jgi:hypothetical protein
MRAPESADLYEVYFVDCSSILSESLRAYWS